MVAAPVYRRTQSGLLIRISLLLGAVALAGIWIAANDDLKTPERLVMGLGLGSLIACLTLFHNLTVEVSREAVRVWFGLGLIRRTIPLENIAACDSVRNPWWYGWGLRGIPGGWMFNIAGLEAVELTLTNGRRFRIGSDEPHTLADAIRGASGVGRAPSGEALR